MQASYCRIVLVKPTGYLHSEAFRELVETVRFGLSAVGLPTEVSENGIDPAAVNLVIGWHLLDPEEVQRCGGAIILYNLEQMDALNRTLVERLIQLGTRFEVWDYSQRNIEILRAHGFQGEIKHVPIGYVPTLSRIAPAPRQDIDVLFYGSMNKRRLSVIQALEATGLSVHVAFGVYGRERDELIARAKVVLNLHYYESSICEMVRISYLLSNRKAVVAEAGADTELESYLREAMFPAPYDQLVGACVELVRDDAARRNLEDQALRRFSTRTEESVFTTLLSGPSILTMVARPASHPTACPQEGGGGSPIFHSGPPRPDLYLELIENCLLNTIYEDPAQDPWSTPSFDSAKRARGLDWPSLAHSMIGRLRMSNIRALVELVLAQGVPGDLIETGVWRGGACIYMRAILKAHGVTDRRVFAADSFQGLPEPDAARYPEDLGDQHHTFESLAVPLEQVQANFAKYGLLDDQVVFLKGWFRDTLPTAPIEKLAVLRLDGDMYESTMDAFVHLYDKLSPGGFLIVDDYGAVPACRAAVEDFRTARGITEPICDIDGIGVYWQKCRTPELFRPASVNRP